MHGHEDCWHHDVIRVALIISLVLFILTRHEFWELVAQVGTIFLIFDE